MKDINSIKEYRNVKEMLNDSVEKFGDRLAFVYKEKTGPKSFKYVDITYKRFVEDINAFGTALYSLGLKGKRVAVIGKNRYEYIVAHYANLVGGIISVPLDKDLQVEELENSLIRAKVNAIVWDNGQLEKINEIKSRGNTELSKYISMSKEEGFECVSDLIEKGKKIIKGGTTDFIDNETDPEVMSILLFTSGTTSRSKAVMLSQKAIMSNVYALKVTEDIYPDDVNIAFLPFHHIFGSTCMLYMVSCGAKTVFSDGLKYIKQNLNEYHVSVFVGVPLLIEAMYKTILKEVKKQGKEGLIKKALVVSNGLRKVGIDIRRKLFKSVIDALGGKLRFVISGGAPADPVMAKGFNDFGIVTIQGYGLTETAPVIAAETPKEMRTGSVGKPFFNQNVEIEDKDENGIGRIKVKGPNLMLGYYEMPEETAEVLVDGWFYTGDLGYIDKDGYLFITGRDKNMIVLKNGKKVFPEEVETIVNRIDLVEECMVFGLPDPEDKLDITLSVKLVVDQEAKKENYRFKTDEEIRDIIWTQIKEINTQFPKYKHIKNMIISETELIKTSTKKVKRQEEMKLILKEMEKESK